MQFESCEAFVTAACPLSCKYCYIPKTREMLEAHKEVLEWVTSGRMVDEIRAFMPDLKFLGFWGAEPLLSMGALATQAENIVKAFPRLESINFSTGMTLDPFQAVVFIKGIDAASTKEIKIGIQVSIDGPDEIMEVNRFGGASGIICKNMKSLVVGLGATNLKNVRVDISLKPTLSMENIRYLVETEGFIKYKRFFEDFTFFICKLIARHSPNRVAINKHSYCPTLAVPGSYTSDDGRVFAEFLRGIHSVGLDSSYTWRLKEMLDNEARLFRRHEFSCSGGKSNIGFDGNIHICHRTFLLNNEKYVEGILAGHDSLDNWDISLLDKGILENLKRYYMPDAKDKYAVSRFSYLMSGYHNFWKMQISSSMAIILELVRAGQASRIYEDKGARIIAATFINKAHSCPIENLMNTGSVHVTPLSTYRIWLNGALEELIKRCGQIGKA